MSQKGTVRDTSIFTPLVSMNYGFYVPAGDFADRFGPNSAIGASGNFKLASQWNFGIEYAFHFSNIVREDSILDGLKTSEGYILNSSGSPANVPIYQRGHTVSLNIGRLFPIFGPNPNSGLMIRFGLGYWQHKIRIETNQDVIPQLTKELKKGYDRLSSGLLLNQFIGYNHLSNSKLINFFIGIDINEGFLSSRRSYNIDQMRVNDDKRFDIQIGLKAGWILPIYRRSPEQFYRY